MVHERLDGPVKTVR